MRLFRTILGMLLLTIGLPALLVGAGLWTTMQHRDAGGAFSGALQNLTAPGYAIVVDDVDTLLSADAPFARVGDSHLRLTGTTADGPAFIGIARRMDATRYLDGVSYARVAAVDLGTGALPVSTTRIFGERAPSSAPSGQSFWLASGTGELDWNPSDLRGRAYSLVIMAADAQPGIRLTSTAELRPGWLNQTTWALMILGSLLIVGGMMALAWPGRRRELVYVVEPSQLPAFAEHLATPPGSDRLKALLRIGRRHLTAFGRTPGTPSRPTASGHVRSGPTTSTLTTAGRTASGLTASGPARSGPARAGAAAAGPAASGPMGSGAVASGSAVARSTVSGSTVSRAIVGAPTGLRGAGSTSAGALAPAATQRSGSRPGAPSAPDLVWPPTRPHGPGVPTNRRIKADGSPVSALRAVPPTHSATGASGRPTSSSATAPAGTSSGFASGTAPLSVVPTAPAARRSPVTPQPASSGPTSPSRPSSGGLSPAAPSAARSPRSGASPSVSLPTGFSLAGFSPTGPLPSRTTPASTSTGPVPSSAAPRSSPTAPVSSPTAPRPSLTGRVSSPTGPVPSSAGPASSPVGAGGPESGASVPGGHRAPGAPRARLEPLISGQPTVDRTSRRRTADRPAAERVFEASAVEAWVAETVATRARNTQARAAAVLAAESAAAGQAPPPSSPSAESGPAASSPAASSPATTGSAATGSAVTGRAAVGSPAAAVGLSTPSETTLDDTTTALAEAGTSPAAGGKAKATARTRAAAKSRTAAVGPQGQTEENGASTVGDRRRSRRVTGVGASAADTSTGATGESSTTRTTGGVAARAADVPLTDGDERRAGAEAPGESANVTVPAARTAGYQAEAKELLEAGATSTAPPRRRRKATAESAEAASTGVKAPRAAARRTATAKPTTGD